MPAHIAWLGLTGIREVQLIDKILRIGYD